MNVEKMEIGTVTAGTMVERRLPRNRKITSVTSPTAINSVLKTSRMDASIKTDES